MNTKYLSKIISRCIHARAGQLQWQRYLSYIAICSLPMTATASGSGIKETVFVTADKLGSNTVQEMATTVNMETGDDLEKKGALELIDFAASVPGLQLQDSGPGDREYIIRGINSTGASTVGVYFDEVPITANNSQDGGGRNMDIKLIDIETVEIFNGPQGTQYGANSMSGLVRYMPRKPNVYENEVKLSLDASQINEGGDAFLASAIANLSLVEGKLAARAVVWNNDSDGWIDQPNSEAGPVEDTNDEDTTGGRFMLRYIPKSNIIFDVMHLEQDMEIGSISAYVPLGEEHFDGVSDADFTNYEFGASPWDESLALSLANLSWEFELGTLTLSGSESTRDIFYVQDRTNQTLSALNRGEEPVTGGGGGGGGRGGGGGGATADDAVTLRADLHPQSRDVSASEIRFASFLGGSFEFFIGAAIRDEDNYWRRQYVEHETGYRFEDFHVDTLFDNANVSGVRLDNEANFFLKQRAIFGEVLWYINDEFTLTAGGRFFESEQSTQVIEHAPRARGGRFNTTPHDNPIAFSESSEDDQFAGKFSIAYQGIENVNLYALVSQGFRVGGLNQNSGEDSDIPVSFGPDSLTNYELGYKTQWLDGDLTFNGSLYFVDWEDMQVLTFFGSTSYISNAGAAEVIGTEVSLDYNINEHFIFSASGGFISKAELTAGQEGLGDDDSRLDFEDDVGQAGDDIPNIADLQLYTSLEYVNSFSWADLRVFADLSYRSSSNTRFNTDSVYNYEIQTAPLVSLRTTLTNESQGWSAALYIKNLTNRVSDFDAVLANDQNLAVWGARPRTIGLKISKWF